MPHVTVASWFISISSKHKNPSVSAPGGKGASSVRHTGKCLNVIGNGPFLSYKHNKTPRKRMCKGKIVSVTLLVILFSTLLGLVWN